MKRIVYIAALAALAASCNALAESGIAHVAIIDRKSGVELVPHFYHGECWVAGTPGATYAIEIRNRLGERLLAVTSVDGVNVITGDTAGWDQAGYVFDPGEGYQITGWRKSDSEVAAFTFTDSPSSYAERTGRPANVGVIGVALFRERAPQPMQAPAPMPSPNQGEIADAAKSRVREAAVPKLGTGHGARETSHVINTEFARMQPQPNEVIRIRYDSFENLLAMGIIERPHSTVPTANPFPASPVQRYVPDPPGT